MVRADVNSITNVNPLVFADGVVHTLASLNFATPAARELVISYFSECADESNDTVTYVRLQILVDGVAVPPTNSDQALCTGIPPDLNGGSLHQWHSVGTTVARTVVAGNHNVRVTGRLIGFAAGERMRIDDQSLVVLEDD